MTPSTSDPNDSDAREQLERGLGFLRRALRSWPMLLGALLLGGVACALFLYLNKPRYRSETVIFYAEKGSTADGGEPTTARAVTIRLKDILLSRPTLERVILKFDPYPDQRRTLGVQEAVDELKKHVEFRAPGGDTIAIAFEGSSPSQAQGITAELARLVIDSDSSLRKGQARAAWEFLSGEKQGTESQLREAEQGLASFMAQHPRFALDATPLTSGAAIRASLAGGSPIGATAGGILRLPTTGSPGGASRQAAASAVVGRTANESQTGEALARAAVAAARENLAEQLLHFTPAHPDVRAAQAALDRATERLVSAQSAGSLAPVGAGSATPEASSPRPPPRSQPVASAPPAALPAHAGDQAKELVELETQWLKLTRAVTEARQRQDQVEGQLFKADIEASSERAGHGVEVSVIDPAFLPERPEPPGRTLIALIFATASLAIGVLGALIRAALDDRLFGTRDLRGLCDVLVEIPRISKGPSARAAI